MDDETRAYLDTALEGLRREIRAGALETATLRQEMREGAGELTAALRQEMREGAGELAATLRQEMREGAGELAATLRQEMREVARETRRHFDVVSESIHVDVRAVAEGVAANSEAIERLGTDLRMEMNSRFTASHAIVRVALDEIRRDIHERGAGR